MMCLIAIICIQVMLMIYLPILYPWWKFGGGKRFSWTGRQDGWGKKTIKKVSKDQILLYENTLFCVFLKISNTGNFDRQISPWKQHLQKKWSIPRRRQRKIQEICHLRFLIFELSSQRFFNLNDAIFHFFENSKKRKLWQTWPANYGCLLNAKLSKMYQFSQRL